MLARGFDMYVGMRKMDEFLACREAKLFNCVIWVDAAKRLPLEGKESNELTAACADFCCDNNGPEEAMDLFVQSLAFCLACGGFRSKPDGRQHCRLRAATTDQFEGGQGAAARGGTVSTKERPIIC